MKKLNKGISLILIMAMGMSLFGCGKKVDDTTDSQASDVATETTIGVHENSSVLTPEDVVFRFINTMASGDTETAYTKFTNIAAENQNQDEIYSAIEVSYYAHMTYETELVSEDETEAVVKVYGTAPDIKTAVNSVYSTDNATAIMAEMILLDGDDFDAKANDPAIKQLMADTIIKYIDDNEPVEFETEYVLVKSADDMYVITGVTEMPEVTFSEDRFSATKLSEIMRAALDLLVADGRITDEKYDEVYKKLFSEEEALAAAQSYINGVINSERGSSGAQGEVAAAYYNGLSYNVSVTGTSGNRITVVVTGTAPDVSGAVAAATSDSTLTSIMVTAAYTAMNSGSVGAGRSVAESMVRDRFYSELSSRGGIPFSSTIYVTMEKDGKYTVSPTGPVFPSMPGSLSLNLDSGRLQSCARSALGSLLASGAITQEEYDRYVGQIGAYL
ncbi:MAG: hypothetical protein MJ108_09635 [Saccharofermentans sp.]|nr:hypothetical protein [Saccharofermentans sp.]